MRPAQHQAYFQSPYSLQDGRPSPTYALTGEVSYRITGQQTPHHGYAGPRSAANGPIPSPTSPGYYADHQHISMITSAPPGRQQYGPGDWQPDCRTASRSPHHDHHPRQYLHQGCSAPVSPHPSLPVTPQYDPLSPMSRSWTQGLSKPSQQLSPNPVSFAAFTPDSYHSAFPTSASTLHISPARFDLVKCHVSPDYHPRAEGRDRARRPHGPPPKAVLGGVGGKTWDELQLVNRSVSAPDPRSSKAVEPHTPSSSQMQSVVQDNGKKAEDMASFKGNPIVVRPPFPAYSPPDSPERPKEGVQNHEGEAEYTKISRKDAFPWPVKSPRGPPETIPLPLSPSDTTMKGRRRRIKTGSSRELMHAGDKEGIGPSKEVAVSVPDPDALPRMKAVAAEKKRLLADGVMEPSDSRARSVQSPPGAEVKLHPSLPPRPESSSSRPHSLDHTPTPPQDEDTIMRSPPSSTRRGSRLRLSDSAFVARHLGGMMKERPKSLDNTTHDPLAATEQVTTTSDVGTPSRNRPPDPSHGPGLSPDSPPGSTDSGAPVADGSPAAVDHPLDPGTAATDVKDEGENSKAEEGFQAAQGPAQALVDAEAESQPARKRKMKLGALNGYLGRQLNSSGLLGPTKREGRNNDAEQHMHHEPREQPSRIEVAPLPVPTSTEETESTDTRKRSRFDSDKASPSSDQRESNVSVATSSTLRANANAFQPRPTGTGAGFRPVPQSQKTFDFGASVDTVAASSSDRPVKNLRPAATVFIPRLPFIPLSNPLPTFERPKSSPRAPSPRTSEDYASAIGAVPASTFGLITDSDHSAAVNGTSSRSASDNGVNAEEPSPGSPAAELHGIYAESPAGSLAYEQLFYRPPESDISGDHNDDPDMESFDPVSYSYDPISDDVFDESEFRTSTPRRDHSHMPSGSSDDLHSSPEQILPRSPLITIAGPAPEGDDKQRFRDWVFPLSEDDQRPSISRRHTFDNSPETGETRGVASTFASRVGDLRAFLAQNINGDHLRVSSAQDHLTSNRSSVEFPIRTPTTRLAVVNDSMSGAVTPVPEPGEGARPVAGAMELGAALAALQATMDHLVSQTARAEQSSDANFEAQVSDLLNRVQPLRSLAEANRHSSLQAAVEQQSALISSMASQLQTHQGHSGDHLDPLLEGQQAVLDRFTHLDARHDLLTQEMEKIGSALTARDVAERDRREAATDAVNVRTIDMLRQQVQQLKLDQQRDQLAHQQALRDLSSAHGQVEQLRNDIQSAQATTREALEAKDELERTHRHLLDDKARLMTDLEKARHDLEEEQKRNEQSSIAVSQRRSADIAQLRQATVEMQQALMDRLEEMAEVQHKSRHVDAALQALRQQNDRLLREIDIMRETNEQDRERYQAVRQDAQVQQAAIDKATLQLVHERQLRAEWQERSKVVEEYLVQEREYRTNAEATARERTYVAELQEARIAELLDEVHHWRSFAMSYDRKAYREYLKSNPFKGLSPTATVTQINGHGPVSGAAASTSTASQHVSGTEAPAGNPWTSEAG